MRFYDINGIDYPSVTTVLDALPKPTALKLFIANNPNAKFIAAERAFIGTMSHFYFESQNSKYLDHEAILEKVDLSFNTQKNKDIKTPYFDQLDNAHDLQDIKRSIVNNLKIEFIQT